MYVHTNLESGHQYFATMTPHHSKKLVVLPNAATNTKGNLPIDYLCCLMIKVMLSPNRLNQVDRKWRWVAMVSRSNATNNA